MKKLVPVLAIAALVIVSGCSKADDAEPTGNKENPNMEFSTQGADKAGGSASSTTEQAAADN